MIASPILTYCIIRSGNLLVTLMCGVYSRSYCLNPQIVWPKPGYSVPLLHLSLDRKVWWDNKHTLASDSCWLKTEKRQVFFSDPWIPYLGPFPKEPQCCCAGRCSSSRYCPCCGVIPSCPWNEGLGIRAAWWTSKDLVCLSWIIQDSKRVNIDWKIL